MVYVTVYSVFFFLQVWHILMTFCPNFGPSSVSLVLREASNSLWSVWTMTLMNPSSSCPCSCSSVTVHGTSSRNFADFYCVMCIRCQMSISSSIYNTLVTVLQNSRWHWSLWRTNIFQDWGTHHYLLVSEHICVQDDMGWHLRWVSGLTE